MSAAAPNLELTRARLTARREELRNRLTRIGADQRREAEPLSRDSEDQVTQTENDQVVDSIGDAARAEILQIDEALRQLEAGRYGICTSCEHPIEAGRLAVVPHASHCTRCSCESDARVTA